MQESVALKLNQRRIVLVRRDIAMRERHTFGSPVVPDV